MELDVLYTHIASPPVVANFSALAQRIADRGLPHGADIIIGIHTRLLKEPHPLPLRAAPPRSTPCYGSEGNEENPGVEANVSSEDTEAAAEPSSAPKQDPPPAPTSPMFFKSLLSTTSTPQHVDPPSVVKFSPPPVPPSMPSPPRPVRSSATPTPFLGIGQSKGLRKCAK